MLARLSKHVGAAARSADHLGLAALLRLTAAPVKSAATAAAAAAAAGPKRGLSAVAPTALPEVMRKARRMSPGTGLLAGLFGSVVGVGGGVVIVPIIVGACKSIPQRIVSGSSLAAVLSTAAASAATYAASGCIDPTAAIVISPMAMLTAPLGAKMTARLNCTALRRLLGTFLVCAAPLVPLKAYLLHLKEQHKAPSGEEQAAPAAAAVAATEAAPVLAAGAVLSSPAPAAPAVMPGLGPALAQFMHEQRQAVAELPPTVVATLLATGAVAGFASGLLGIGGGTIVTPLLALTMPYGQVTVLGTSLLSMVPPSLAGLVQHARMGNVDWRMAAGLAAGTAVGGALGSASAVSAPPGVLEACFSVGMLLLGRKTLQTAK